MNIVFEEIKSMKDFNINKPELEVKYLESILTSQFYSNEIKKYFNLLFPKIIEHHKSIPSNKVDLPIGNLFRNFDTQKFIGLKNYGATCYLNSLFQQMFMIPTFYQDLFKFDITEKNQNLSDSTIYNMQLAFINLKKSCMQYYTPINFIHSFKNAFNGEPISLGTQQDTDEFLLFSN